MSATRDIARQSLSGLAREGTVWLIAVLFVSLVLVSAWLGWSATRTVDAIYADAAAYLQSVGQPVPPNPVTKGAALALLRNLPIYISLIGTFAAIVIGQCLIEADRQAGVLPLILSRPIGRWHYAQGKALALVVATGALVALAAGISTTTLALLPSASITTAQAARLAEFFGLSWVYLLIFGAVALGATARIGATAGGMLAASVLWLAVTFVLPALTGNIHPTAAINPVSALAPAPDTAVFHLFGTLLGPASLTESYKYLSADLLGYLPTGLSPRGAVSPLADLMVALGLAAGLALAGCLTLSPTDGGPDA